MPLPIEPFDDPHRRSPVGSPPVHGTRLVVGVGGGTGSGKTTFAHALVAQLPMGSTSVIDHDAYYHDLAERPLAERERVNFDHPDSLDNALLVSHLRQLRAGRSIVKPRYDFATHTRCTEGVSMHATPIVIVEGILVLAILELRENFDLKLFVDAPADLRLLRRIRRDLVERGRHIDGIDAQYLATVRPMHDAFVEPSRTHADLVLSGHGAFGVALRTTADALRHRLRLD
jgi:uridine kinase